MNMLARRPKQPAKDWSQEAVMRYWIRERHAIYLAKEADPQGPWTADRVLRTFRFCNISRRFDKMTKRLIRDCNGATAHARFMTVVAYRMFNRLEVWNAISPYVSPWNARAFRHTVKAMADSGAAVTSGVWMVGGARGRPCWDTNMEAPEAANAQQHLVDYCALSVESAFEAFISLPWVGPFVANEMAMDALYHARLVKRGDKTWVRLGPGATRGIRRLTGKPDPGWQPPKAGPADYEALHQLHQSMLARPPVEGVELTIHDVEHCLCEYDKYCRAHFEGARMKNIYRGG